MNFALMFEVLEGGVSEIIKWDANNLAPDKNIIILDEASSSLYLWYGSKQGLVARRTALRQAESLKGHGYVAGKSIIGRDIRHLKEIDQRKVGRDPVTDNLNDQIQNILNKEFKELDNYIITFDIAEAEAAPVKAISKPEVQEVPVKAVSEPEVKTPPVESEITPKAKPVSGVKIEKVSVPKPKPISPATEYDTTSEIGPKVIPETPSKKLIEPEKKLDLDLQAKIGFVLIAILDHYDDIWVSKKDDGSYGVEMMDGPICQFSIKEGSKISFTANSFSGIATNVKIEIQKKFVELSKLLK